MRFLFHPWFQLGVAHTVGIAAAAVVVVAVVAAVAVEVVVS